MIPKQSMTQGQFLNWFAYFSVPIFSRCFTWLTSQVWYTIEYPLKSPSSSRRADGKDSFDQLSVYVPMGHRDWLVSRNGVQDLNRSDECKFLKVGQHFSWVWVHSRMSTMSFLLSSALSSIFSSSFYNIMWCELRVVKLLHLGCCFKDFFKIAGLIFELLHFRFFFKRFAKVRLH